MTQHDRGILAEFAQRVRSRFPEARVWAFGSRARGDAAPDSDLDVCVVVDRLDEAGDKDIMAAAWEVGFPHDIVISTLTFSHDAFTVGPLSQNSVVHDIRRYGVSA